MGAAGSSDAPQQQTALRQPGGRDFVARTQRQLLTEMGCDAFQGYYFGRTILAGDLLALVAQIGS